MCYLDNEIYSLERASVINLWSIRHLISEPHGVNGHRLTSINIHWKESTVLIILKKESPKGHQVAFLEARDLDDALFVMAHAIKSKTIRWRVDEWQMRRLDKKGSND